MINFWTKLQKPFFVLAPMTDVTDSAFRQIVIECGSSTHSTKPQGGEPVESTGLTVNKPDVFYTEFVSCDGLCSSRFLPNQDDLVEKSRILDFVSPKETKSGEKGKLKLLKHLKFKENERPIVAQFFGSKPENFFKCAQLAKKLGFDGIDINMGCPDRKVLKQGGGAALILKPELAKEIIKETKRGARSTSSGQAIPVSVKTRIGFNSIITEEWLSHLVEAQPAAIIVHGRTKKEMSKVPAHWDEISKAAVIARKSGIPIIGNGDVLSYQEGVKKAEQYGLDGIMVGRGIFSNPWFFNPKIDPASKTPKERIKLMKRHIKLFTELWGDNKHFDIMKKFFKVYISGWDGAKELRVDLMKAHKKEDIIKILTNKNEI